MIYLDRNENHFGPAPECLNILRTASPALLTTYTRDFTRGVKSILSEALAEKLSLPEEQILLSYGSEDMLKQIVHCYLSAGEIMMVPQYSWWYYKSVALEVSGTVVEYPLEQKLTRHTNIFVYNSEVIISLVKKNKPKLLLMASPNNPTGNSLSFEELKTIANECRDTLIILDEAYFGFTQQSQTAVPQLVHEYPNLAVLRTFSKLYALAGLRIGYSCIGKNFSTLQTYSKRYLGYNTLSELVALAALRNEEYYSGMAQKISEERVRIAAAFSSTQTSNVFASEANFLLVKFLNGDAHSMQKFLSDHGVAIKTFSEKELHGYVRITIGIPEQNSALLTAVEQYHSQKIQSTTD